MAKKAALPKTKIATYSWLFVAIWPVIAALLINSSVSPLSGMIAQLDITASAWVTIIIVLAPIATVLLPLIYRMDSDENRETPIPAWKRTVFSILATSLLLGAFGYFYLIVSLVFATNFD